MVPITEATAAVRELISEWRHGQTSDLRFTHRDSAIIAVVVVVIIAVAMLIARALARTKAGRTQIALPAVLKWSGGSRTSILRHGALLLFLAGLPFFVMALADPYSSLVHEQVSFPGRRIALMLDASSSMAMPFPAAHLTAGAPTDATFFTAVAGATTFIQRRLNGKYHDLIGLIEFGDEAYVVTPFTTDYENIMLSLSLVGDSTEFMKFPDKGTTIGLAIDQSVGLFKAFDFLDAAGNLMLIFSDGQDTQVMIHGESVNEILKGARQSKIPVYFIRTSYSNGLGAVLPDAIWKPAVEATGGKFYPAADEAGVLDAISDIDSRSAGRVDVRRYGSRQPQFAGYALIAAGFWLSALTLQLTVPYFRKFP